VVRSAILLKMMREDLNQLGLFFNDNVFWLNRHWKQSIDTNYRADPGHVDAAADLSSCQRHLIRDR
jgi:hypothetical protein